MPRDARFERSITLAIRKHLRMAGDNVLGLVEEYYRYVGVCYEAI